MWGRVLKIKGNVNSNVNLLTLLGAIDDDLSLLKKKKKKIFAEILYTLSLLESLFSCLCIIDILLDLHNEIQVK